MALTQEQQAGLLKAYQQGIASGLTKEQSTAAVKDYLLKSGQYDSAKAAAQGTVVQPAATPAQAPVQTAQPYSAPKPTAAAPAPVSPKPTVAQAPSAAPAPKPAATPKATAAVNNAIVTPQRSQQINANLTEGAKNAKQNFTDVNAFKAAYGYDQKPEGEKAILDSFWSKYAEQNAIKPVAAPVAPTPVSPTKDALVTAIWNNQETPEMKASPEYQGLKNAADKARRFSSMSADELVGAITGSQITDAQASVISKLDPSFGLKWNAAKAQYNLQISSAVINESAASLANSALGSEVGDGEFTAASYEDPIIAAINKQIEAISTASAITQAEKDAQLEVNSKKAKIDELTQSRDKIYEDIVATHPGLPKSLTMAMAAEKAKPINEQISTLTREANLALGIYNAAVENRNTSGDTAKTVASLNLEVAKRYADVQEARAKALQEKLKDEKLETKVETIGGRKLLINTQTGETVKDLGADMENSKWEIKEVGGKQYFYDPVNKVLQPALTEGQYDWTASTSLAKEYQGTQTAKDFMTIANQVMKMNQLLPEFRSGKITSGVMDIAIIKTMEKMLDPNSVVREGEFNTYLSAAGIKDKTTSFWDRIIEGGKVPDEIRDALVLAISKQYDASVDVVKPLQDSFMKNIQSVNADPVRVFGGFMVANQLGESYKSLMEDEEELWMSAL